MSSSAGLTRDIREIGVALRRFRRPSRINLKSACRSVSGYLNYALGRVYFYGPVTGGFITEPHHIEETGRFLAPMDQTHTLTGGVTYRHGTTGIWASLALEYGSGTPLETEDDDETGSPPAESSSDRVPGHVVANLSVGTDLWRHSKGMPNQCAAQRRERDEQPL